MTSKRPTFFLITFLIFNCLSASGIDENRTILAIYDSHDILSPGPGNNIIHNNAEMVLNYLGLKVRYHDLASGVPSEDTAKDIYGIILWLKLVNDNYIPESENFLKWLTEEVKEGKKLVLLGTIRVFRDKKTGEVLEKEKFEELFNALGLEYYGDWTYDPFVVNVIEKDSNMVEFERSLANEAAVYQKVTAKADKSKVYLRLNRDDIENSVSDAVVTTPYGGYALDTYEVFINEINQEARWRINPFLFFEEAFNIKNAPRYDTTTLYGNRIFYSHIDGDGFRNISKIDDSSLCGKVILDNILKKYDLPITVSFISCEVDSEYLGSDETMELARNILKLDNVEAGSHGFSHPLDWEKKLTAFPLKGYSKKKIFQGDSGALADSVYEDAAIVTVDREEYLDKEVRGATTFINHELLPDNKRVNIYQWTGNCSPPAKAIEIADKMGIANINGGDTRFDMAYPSYTNVAPLSRMVDGERQIYTSSANENLYTNGWSSSYGGYRNVIETFKETEYPTFFDANPRRVTPINIYYHFYSGERAESLKALKMVYDYVLSLEAIPIFTSHYAKIVNGFFSGHITNLDDGGWVFTGYADCRTVRIDETGLFPDLDKSKNIIGFTKWNDILYVYLDGTDAATLYLSSKAPLKLYLSKASAVLDNLELGESKITFKTRTYRESYYRFANVSRNDSYILKIYDTKNGKDILSKKIRSNKEGILDIKLREKGEFRVEVTKA